MPRLCHTCNGSRRVERSIDRTWWQSLLGRPAVVSEACPTCGGAGVIKGSPEEEALGSIFERLDRIGSLPYAEQKRREEELTRELASLRGAALDGVVASLSRGDYRIASLASGALKQVGTPAVDPLIRALSTSDDSELIRRGAELLGELRARDSVPTLISLVRGSDASGRRAAVEALGKIADAAAVQPLIEMLSEPIDRDLAAAACISLSKLADSRAIESVLKALSRLRFDRSNDRDIDSARQAIAKSLETYPVKDLVGLLAAHSADESTGAEAVALLAKVLESPDVGQVPEADLVAVSQLAACKGLSLNTRNMCAGKHFGESTPVDTTRARQLARQELVRRGGEHKWVGCKCTDCGLIRDEEHDWDGCVCRACAGTRHDWSECECRSCGLDRHVWSGCGCRNCKTERHEWDRCRCRTCRTTRHEWERVREDGGWKYYKCKLCGKTGQMPQDTVWLSGNDPFPD